MRPSPARARTPSPRGCTGTATPRQRRRIPARAAACVHSFLQPVKRKPPGCSPGAFRFGSLVNSGSATSTGVVADLPRLGPNQYQTAQAVAAVEILCGDPRVGRVELDCRDLARRNQIVELRAGHALIDQPHHRLTSANPDRVATALIRREPDAWNTPQKLAGGSGIQASDPVLIEEPPKRPLLPAALVESAELGGR